MPNTQTSVPAFTAGQVLTAQQQTEINTGIPVFATTTTRDAAFGGTGEKVLAEGQFAYIEATNTTQYYDGAAWQTVGGGLTLIKTQTIGSAVSSVQVTDAFSSTYDIYLITINGGTGSATQDLTLQLGATTTGYYGFMVYGAYNLTTVSGVQVNNGANWTYGGNVATVGTRAFITLANPNLAKETYIESSWIQTGTVQLAGTFKGYLNNTTQYTAFTIASVATMTGGTIRVYGYQNS